MATVHPPDLKKKHSVCVDLRCAHGLLCSASGMARRQRRASAASASAAAIAHASSRPYRRSPERCTDLRCLLGPPAQAFPNAVRVLAETPAKHCWERPARAARARAPAHATLESGSARRAAGACTRTGRARTHASTPPPSRGTSGLQRQPPRVRGSTSVGTPPTGPLTRCSLGNVAASALALSSSLRC